MMVKIARGKGQWRTFGIQDGLPTLAVGAIFHDRKGNLWFSIWSGGVSRYDGKGFTTFTAHDGLAADTVTSILEDRTGNLWFGTNGGVSRYDGQSFLTLTTNDGLANNTVTSILKDRKGVLWFGTKRGVSRYDGERFTTFAVNDGLAADTVTSILEDRAGHLWFGTWGSGVSRYDEGRGQPGGLTVEGQFTTFTTNNGLAGNDVRVMLEDRAGNLWFGALSGGVSRYDGYQFTTFTTNDGLAHNGVTSIMEDRAGNLWFGTWEGGVSRYDGTQFMTFTTEDGLLNDKVQSMLEDRNGRLWLTTWGGGVILYDERFTTLTTADGLPRNTVHSILEDRDGNLWFGTDRGGVSRYDGRQLTTFTTNNGLAHNRVLSILEDRNGNLWFGTWGGGVSRYNEGRGQPGGLTVEGQFTTFTANDGLAGNDVRALSEDRDGNLWFGMSGGGVSRYDGHRFTTFTTNNGLAHDRVLSILEDRNGNLWFGTWGGGVSRYNGHQFTTFTTNDGLAHNDVQAMLEDRDGNLWFGTRGGGVSRYDGYRFTTFTTHDGLAHNEINSIWEDRAGHLWFGTFGGGVSRYDGLVFQNLLKQDGLADNAVWQILQDRNGDIWITTEGGVTHYSPGQIPPTIHITDVIADRHYGEIQELCLPISQALIIFKFQGQSWSALPDRMVYVYQLEGYDRGWRQTRECQADYMHLPLGSYVFRVKAVDQDLQYSEMAEVRLTVIPDPRIVELTEALQAGGVHGEFIGESPALKRILTQIQEVARTDMTVLIVGETGTGKGLVARAIHGASARVQGPFIQVNCGTLPEGLVESELFGHERGAFTGAVTKRLGRVELSEGGTLFLDEIGDLTLGAQVKLLRFLEERTFERVGGEKTLQGDVRVIAATNRDLEQMMEKGRFREDLYFRLKEFAVRVPPLRERREDIPLLVQYFAERFAKHLHRPLPLFTGAVLKVLQEYTWPGNVRELEHVVQRAVLVCRRETIGVDDVPEMLVREWQHGNRRMFVPLEEYERRYLEEVLLATGWVIYGSHGAAHVLGVDPEKLRGRMKKYGLRRPR